MHRSINEGSDIQEWNFHTHPSSPTPRFSWRRNTRSGFGPYGFPPHTLVPVIRVEFPHPSIISDSQVLPETKTPAPVLDRMDSPPHILLRLSVSSDITRQNSVKIQLIYVFESLGLWPELVEKIQFYVPLFYCIIFFFHLWIGGGGFSKNWNQFVIGLRKEWVLLWMLPKSIL
ncbi:hypothetical protein CEXT_775091 [Caerostris extrusa]|uniref:Uncharacterized protein n=1 Tax=Caerostris extrusa TaxID=172846 RepID=A0AAV4N9P6_CAEEX|nr:hypothetical protein CEXT_775091 [Caerostris extrusa]